MLTWALIFAVIALVAGVFGFGGVASAAAGVARILFFIFIVVFLALHVGADPSGTRGPDDDCRPTLDAGHVPGRPDPVWVVRCD